MSKKQNLLILGCGDLAKRLVSSLDFTQWSIDALRRSPIELAGVHMEFGDASDPKIINRLVQQNPDQLLVTLTPDARSTEAYIQTYLRPAQAISAAAKIWAPQCHLIFVSSTSVYGQGSGEHIDEQSAAEPKAETAQILVQAEGEIASAGNPWSLVRFSGIYGPGRERLIDKVSSAEFTEPNNASWTNRMHSEDCAGVLAHLLQHPVLSEKGAGIVIGTDNAPVLNTEVEKWLAGELGIEYPEFDMKALSPSGKRCSNMKLLDSGYRLLYPSYREGYLELIGNR